MPHTLSRQAFLLRRLPGVARHGTPDRIAGVNRIRPLVASGFLAFLVALPVVAQEQSGPSLFADAVGLGFTGTTESVVVTDAADDLFTLEGASADGPAHLDILRTEQFGFTITSDAFELLFGGEGSLDCDRPEVSCPTYEVQAEPFTEGVYVVAIELAAAPEVEGTDVFTVAVLANDDDWPQVQDPRPNSPFVGTNKAWRVDFAAENSSVRFLQVVTGPYEEFHTDVRVLQLDAHVWFVMPPSELPLTSTILFLRGHTYLEPVADVDGEGANPAQLAPVGLSGELIAAPPVTTTAPTSATTSAASAPATTAEAGETTSPVSAGGRFPVALIIVAAIAAALILIFVLRPKRRCEKEYEAWQMAVAECDKATAAAERSEAEADRLRAELDELRKSFPPLGFDQSDESTIELDDGTTMSQLDLALGAWDAKNRQPPVSEGTAGPRSETAARSAAQRERLREEYREMKAKETALIVKVSEAEAAARRAEETRQKACAAAEAAYQAYLQCMGEAAPGATGPMGTGGEGQPPTPPAPGPIPPEPTPPAPTPPAPAPPPPRETPKPPPPTPPLPPPPTPSEGDRQGTDELPRQCEEGAVRETDVQVATFEMLRDRGRAIIRISNDLTDDVEEFSDIAIGAINEASRWAAARARIRGQEGVLYTIDVAIQMERVKARCYRPEICRNGRWVLMSYTQREVGESEYFDKTIHREDVDSKTLRHILQTARNEAGGGGREALDRFCR